MTGASVCACPRHSAPALAGCVSSALELAGLDRVELLAGHLVHGQQLAGAVAVLVEPDLTGGAGALVGLHVLDQVGPLAVVPGPTVDRGAEGADDHVRRVIGERTV